MRAWPSLRAGRRRAPAETLGAVLLLVGLAGLVAGVVPGVLPDGQRAALVHLGVVLSALGATGRYVLPRLWTGPDGPQPTASADGESTSTDRRSVAITSDLLAVLRSLAADAEPASVSIGLAVTPAGRFEGETGLPDSQPVFTHLIPPTLARSTSRVFGVDLVVPPRGTQGRFVSHPHGDLSVSNRDTLHEVVLVAVPPWDERSVAAFDRSGRRLALEPLDRAPPPERVPGSVEP